MKLNQFAVYRVNQQTKGKVLWHLPYQEAIRQNVPIRIESYRLISIQPMQGEEKVSDIWKWIKKQCEVSDVLALNRNGEINCYYVDENYPQYLAGFIRINTSGTLITMDTENYQIDGKNGNWMATDTIIIDGEQFYLMEHQKYGNQAQGVILDAYGKMIVEECERGFDEATKQKIHTLLVSVMHVNNETGITQPVYEIGEALQDKDVLFHVDATQSFGKLVEELQQIKYNMLSMSAHKLGGPQGIGALILRKQRYKLPPVKPIMYGGQQEHGIRPGTLPVALIAGLGKACEIAEKEYKTNIQQCRNIKNKINTMLEESGLEYKYNGLQEYAMPTTMNICFKGVSSEALMLSSKDFCSISNGSACNSKSYSPSYVLLAMGIPKDQIESSVRISWGHDITIDEIEKSFQNVIEAAKGLVW